MNDKIILKSKSIKNNVKIPRKYSCKNQGGEDISPDLSWNKITNAKSYALLVFDPDAPSGTWIHWLISYIPPNINNFGKSIADAQQLHSITRAECIRNVNSAYQFNNQLQCGVPNAMTGLMAQEPEMAQCVINLQQQKMDMLDGCKMLNN